MLSMRDIRGPVHHQLSYILRRTDQDGGWVAMPGSKKSYTHNRSIALRFSSREAADRERCPRNEAIEEL